MIKISSLLSLFLLFTVTFTYAQDENVESLDSGLVQLSGVVVSEETLGELPYTTVLDKTSNRGVFCDYYGYFTIVVYPGDTLLFSAYGHKTSNYIVPDTLDNQFYSIIHVMEVDTIDLPDVKVYPWPSKEDFARAFVNMDPYDDAIRRAQRQLSGESLAFAAARLDVDGSLAYGTVQSQYQTQLYTQNQLPANNLLNPYAWSKLIKDWKEGKLSRQ
jgi:hypothetical protein